MCLESGRSSETSYINETEPKCWGRFSVVKASMKVFHSRVEKSGRESRNTEAKFLCSIFSIGKC